MLKVNDVLTYLQERFPLDACEDFDKGKIGLVMGDGDNNVMNVMCSLDLTLPVVKDAICRNVDLIVTHHPFLFNPISKILYNDSDKGKIITLMIKNNISLICMHTNMDLGQGGVGDSIAGALELKNIVKDTYLRMGEINATHLADFANKIKSKFSLSGVRAIGKKDKIIKKVAVFAGSGGYLDAIDTAYANGCDCYITSEVKHHIGIYVAEKDMALIEVNHGIERFVFQNLQHDLQKKFNIDVIISSFNSDPFYFL